MAENSKIEWCDHTFNPWVGCTKVSPACDHCYAESWAKRTGSPDLWQGKRRRTSVTNWRGPLKWNDAAEAAGVRARVFCASLADVFDNDVPAAWRFDLFRLIRQTPHLDWLLLTKRIGNARDMLNQAASYAMADFVGAATWDRDPWPNVWLGATAANQDEARRDVMKLLETPAVIHFLSVEPMLGPITFVRPVAPGIVEDMTRRRDGVRLDWVIAGGESGPGARPMQRDWVRSLRDQCAELGIAFLFKQWGEHAPNWFNDETGREIPGSMWMSRMGKKIAGRELDGRLHDNFPEAIR